MTRLYIYDTLKIMIFESLLSVVLNNQPLIEIPNSEQSKHILYSDSSDNYPGFDFQTFQVQFPDYTRVYWFDSVFNKPINGSIQIASDSSIQRLEGVGVKIEQDSWDSGGSVFKTILPSENGEKTKVLLVLPPSQTEFCQYNIAEKQEVDLSKINLTQALEVCRGEIFQAKLSSPSKQPDNNLDGKNTLIVGGLVVLLLCCIGSNR